MALVFSCITAHTPLLMPNIGKDSLEILEKTRLAMDELEKELYVRVPETLLVISPHGKKFDDAVSIELDSKYSANFEEFGDLVTKPTWKPDTMLVDSLREYLKAKDLPLTLSTAEYLDYGMTVPLYYLTRHLPNVKVIPMVVGKMSSREHYEFGKALKTTLTSTTHRVAVIASAELSQCLSEDAPGGFSQKGVEYDAKIKEILETDHHLSLLDIDAKWIEESKACGTNVLAVLLGLLEDVNHKTTVLSYEKPFGVGYLMAFMGIK